MLTPRSKLLMSAGGLVGNLRTSSSEICRHVVGISGIPLPAAGDTVSVLTSMAQEASMLLRERGQTIVVAETSTGGLISSALLAYLARRRTTRQQRALYLESRKKLLCITRQDVEGLAPMSEGLVMAFAQGSGSVRCHLGDCRAGYRWTYGLPMVRQVPV